MEVTIKQRYEIVTSRIQRVGRGYHCIAIPKNILPRPPKPELAQNQDKLQLLKLIAGGRSVRAMARETGLPSSEVSDLVHQMHFDFMAPTEPSLVYLGWARNYLNVEASPVLSTKIEEDEARFVGLTAIGFDIPLISSLSSQPERSISYVSERVLEKMQAKNRNHLIARGIEDLILVSPRTSIAVPDTRRLPK